jgi:ferredoxin
MDADTTVKVSVDQGRCSGHGRCASAAPTIYELDEDGYCAVTELRLDAAQRSDAVMGADACPESAISVS